MSVMEIFKSMEYGPAPESPAAVNAWLDEHGRKFGLFINNHWHHPGKHRLLSQLQPGHRRKAGRDGPGRPG